MGVRVGSGVLVGVRVRVGQGVRVGVMVAVGARVRVTVGVGVRVRVGVIVRVGVGCAWERGAGWRGRRCQRDGRGVGARGGRGAGRRWGAGWGRRAGGGSRGRWRGRFPFDGEATGGFPGVADEDLHFIFTGQPEVRFGFPIGVTDPAGAAIPGLGLVMHQLGAAVPQGCPLGFWGHLVVGELGVEMADRILEGGGRVDGEEILIQVQGKQQRAEDGCWIGGDGADELDLDRQGHMGRGGDGGGVGDERGGGDGGAEGDGGRKARLGGERDGGGEGWRDGGREEAIGNRFGKAIDQQAEDEQDNGRKQHAPAGDHAVAAHAEEFERAGLANGTDATPDQEYNRDPGKDDSGPYGGVDIELHDRFQECLGSAATGLRRVPRCSMVTSTRSPARSGLTPAGVPVMSISPGSRVMIEEAKAISCSMWKTISRVEAIWRISPLTWQVIIRSAGSSSVSIHGPRGQKVSKPLPRVHCPSRRCRSRAVTSLPMV